MRIFSRHLKISDEFEKAGSHFQADFFLSKFAQFKKLAAWRGLTTDQVALVDAVGEEIERHFLLTELDLLESWREHGLVPEDELRVAFRSAYGGYFRYFEGQNNFWGGPVDGWIDETDDGFTIGSIPKLTMNQQPALVLMRLAFDGLVQFLLNCVDILGPTEIAKHGSPSLQPLLEHWMMLRDEVGLPQVQSRMLQAAANEVSEFVVQAAESGSLLMLDPARENGSRVDSFAQEIEDIQMGTSGSQRIPLHPGEEVLPERRSQHPLVSSAGWRGWIGQLFERLFGPIQDRLFGKELAQKLKDRPINFYLPAGQRPKNPFADSQVDFQVEGQEGDGQNFFNRFGFDLNRVVLDLLNIDKLDFQDWMERLENFENYQGPFEEEGEEWLWLGDRSLANHEEESVQEVLELTQAFRSNNLGEIVEIISNRDDFATNFTLVRSLFVTPFVHFLAYLFNTNQISKEEMVSTNISQGMYHNLPIREFSDAVNQFLTYFPLMQNYQNGQATFGFTEEIGDDYYSRRYNMFTTEGIRDLLFSTCRMFKKVVLEVFDRRQFIAEFRSVFANYLKDHRDEFLEKSSKFGLILATTEPLREVLNSELDFEISVPLAGEPMDYAHVSLKFRCGEIDFNLPDVYKALLQTMFEGIFNNQIFLNAIYLENNQDDLFAKNKRLVEFFNKFPPELQEKIKRLFSNNFISAHSESDASPEDLQKKQRAEQFLGQKMKLGDRFHNLLISEAATMYDLLWESIGEDRRKVAGIYEANRGNVSILPEAESLLESLPKNLREQLVGVDAWFTQWEIYDQDFEDPEELAKQREKFLGQGRYSTPEPEEEPEFDDWSQFWGQEGEENEEN